VADVTIRYEPTGEERQIDETAVPFFPDWVVLDAAGRRKANQPTTTEKKD
jgi:hypothetical protein